MCFNDPSSDPRPRRTIELLKSNGFTVDCIGSPMSEHLLLDRIFEIPEPDKKFISRIFRRLRLYFIQFLPIVTWGNYLRDLLNDLRYNVFSFRNKIMVNNYNVIIVEDLQLLPIAFRIKNSANVIFDAREYYPRQNEDSLVFRFLEKPERVRLCREYLGRCEKVITVSPGLANEYKKEFGVTADIVYSFPIYHDVEAVTTNPDRIRMVHHGVANRNRRLENMIDIVNKLDNHFSLDFYLNGNQKYIYE